MPLNQQKCQQMIISKARNTSLDSYAYPHLQLVTSVRILGVTFTNNLKWKIHFDGVTLSASRRLHILRCLRSYVPKEKLFTVFRATVLGVILYASPLFGSLPHSVQSAVDRILKRAHRIICGPPCQSSCNFVLNIAELRDRAARDLLLKCEIADHPLHKLVPPRMARTKHFRLPHCKTLRRLK